MSSSLSRSLMHRIAPLFAARIRQNQRLLTSYSSALLEPPSPSQSLDAIHMTENCVQKMKELQVDEASAKKKLLRLSIEAGGCSGFQYTFSLDDKTNADDRIFEREGVKLVVDNISFDFVKGATVDYVEELIRSAFQVMTITNSLVTQPLCLRRGSIHHALAPARIPSSTLHSA
ncbi:iron-sulfur assembly protein IscA-like 2, mitochondrial isoform X2 [Actinidia eriantha]|uniref:iron-sulfur assembly protein IscA-like 2, mitochondrial isoform X2 n=1 Tax=Actinidia eriantha TaxID=165200 RepID=UPI00258F62F0|nr:iron-sulfur assembly protein IscA-like 2, mitochondrial isoform X2 [Actinidia eriantha]